MQILASDASVFDRTVITGLARLGIACDVAEPFSEIASILRDHGPYDAVLLCVAKADEALRAVLHDLRRRDGREPVLVLAGQVSVQEELTLLRLGADEVLRQPIPATLLAARLRAPRRPGPEAERARLGCGNVALDPQRRRASVDGQPLPLTGREYAVLESMLLHGGTVLTKEHLMHRLYHDDDRPELRVLDVFICRLRRKLAARGATPIIRTVRGRGYLAALPGAARPGAALASQTVG